MTEATKSTITFCSTSYFEYDRRMQRILEALIRSGHTINWISRRKNKSSAPIQGINHIILQTRIKKGPLFYLEFNLRCLIALLKSSTDILSSVDLDTIVAARLAAVIKKKVLVFDAHEIFYEVPELEGKAFKKAIWKGVARLTIPFCDAAYTVNHSLRQHYESGYKKAFEVIYNVPEIGTFPPIQTESKSNTIVYLGVLNKGRGLELAIEAMPELKDYTLILIGDGDISDDLKALSHTLKLHDRVKFMGYVTPDQIPDILRQAKIAINILEANSENYRLSLANKFFDYIHAGVPSINMAYPEYLNIINDIEVGICIDNYSKQDFISAVRKLENAQYYNGIVHNCKKAMTQYAWHKEADKLIALYNTLTHRL